MELLLITSFLFVAAGCPTKKPGRVVELQLPTDVGELYQDLGFEYAGLKEAEEEIIALRDSAGLLPHAQLTTLLSHDPATYDYDFPGLCDSAGFYVKESPDRNLRFYGWKTGETDGIATWENLIQFRSADRTYVYLGSVMDFSGQESFPVGPIGDVQEIALPDGAKGYLLRVRWNETADLERSMLIALSIGEAELLTADIFPEDSEGRNVSLRQYSLKCWNKRSDNNSDGLYNYDSNLKTVYVPEVDGVDPTDRYSLYVLENGRFNYVGDDGGFWLHPTIRDFKRLEVMFATRQFMVRIDRMPDESYRYASWSDEVDMIGQPDIILYNGAYDPETNTYSFTNGSFEYRVCPGAPVDELTVFQKDEKILSENRISK